MLGIGVQQAEALHGELANAGPELHQVGASDVGGVLNECLAGIVDLVLVEAKAVLARIVIKAFMGGVLNYAFEVVACKLEHLLKHYFVSVSSKGLMLFFSYCLRR